jgi:hypothetical protein
MSLFAKLIVKVTVSPFIGYQKVDKKIGEGNFFCPTCRDDTAYSLHRVSNNFTAYSMTIFRLKTLGKYVECHRCAGQYDPSIVDAPRSEVDELDIPWICFNCRFQNKKELLECMGCQNMRPDQILD